MLIIWPNKWAFDWLKQVMLCCVAWFVSECSMNRRWSSITCSVCAWRTFLSAVFRPRFWSSDWRRAFTMLVFWFVRGTSGENNNLVAYYSIFLMCHHCICSWTIKSVKLWIDYASLSSSSAFLKTYFFMEPCALAALLNGSPHCAVQMLKYNSSFVEPISDL